MVATPSSQPAMTLCLPMGELKWPAAVERAVKFLALGAALIEPAGVMHHANLTRPRRGAGADFGVGDLQAGWCGHRFSELLSRCRGGGADRKDAGQSRNKSERQQHPRAWESL